MDKSKINKILLINFLTLSTFNMAHPVTPTLMNAIGLPTFMFGVLYSAMAIAQFVMSPVWGTISDMRGRKKVLTVGVIGYGVSQLGFGFAQNSIVILLFRILGGAMAAGYMTSSVAYVSDVSTKKERIKYMSYYTATTSIASSCGALLGGYIGGFGYKYTFIVQFICAMLVGLSIYFLLDETVERKTGKIKVYLDHLKPNKQSIDLKSVIGVMMIVMTLATIATTSYNSTINYYVESVLNMPTIVNGIVMAVAGVIALIMNLFVNPYLGKKYNENKTLIVVLGVAGTSIIIASVTNNIILSLVFLAVFIGSSALVTPLQQSIVSKLAKDNYGEVMGVQGSFKAIGMVTGSLLAGFIFDIWNKLPFTIGGICCILSYIILKNNNFNNNRKTKE